MSNSYQSGSRAPDQSNIIKILVATDIHLGYAEKNPIKAEDSFNTFDEILKIGIEEGKLCQRQDTKLTTLGITVIKIIFFLCGTNAHCAESHGALKRLRPNAEKLLTSVIYE
jgi:hypothetical protein